MSLTTTNLRLDRPSDYVLLQVQQLVERRAHAREIIEEVRTIDAVLAVPVDSDAIFILVVIYTSRSRHMPLSNTDSTTITLPLALLTLSSTVIVATGSTDSQRQVSRSLRTLSVAASFLGPREVQGARYQESVSCRNRGADFC